MLQQLPRRYAFARLLASTATSAIVVLGLCSCQTAGTSDITGSVGEKTETSRAADPRREVDIYRRTAFAPTPRTPTRRCNTGGRSGPRGSGPRRSRCSNRPQSLTPVTRPFLPVNGRALADNGNFQQAFDVLSQAHTPDDPDWRILSAQGATLDQLGRYDEARQYYASALKIAPEEPSVLSNLGLSYPPFKRSAQSGGDFAPRA